MESEMEQNGNRKKKDESADLCHGDKLYCIFGTGFHRDSDRMVDITLGQMGH